MQQNRITPEHWFDQSGPGVSLIVCCFVVHSTRRFVVCLSMCHFVLVVFSPFTSLGEERANLSAFRTFVRFCLFGFVGFLFLLGSGKGCGLCLWHSLDFSLTFVFRHCLPSITNRLSILKGIRTVDTNQERA